MKATLLLAVLSLVACGRTEPLRRTLDGGQLPSPLDAGQRDGGKIDAGPPEVGLAQELIYLHDTTTLFSFVPSPATLTRLGTMRCGDSTTSVTDLAIDRLGRGFAVADDLNLYRINLQTAECRLAGAMPEFVAALAFLPAGVLGADEALVGYGTTSYFQFDLTSGLATELGSSFLSNGLHPSGDLAALNDGGTFLTVTDDGMGPCNDCLVRIDPRTGEVLQNFGDLGVGTVWGLAAFDDRLFAFNSEGRALRIDLVGNTVRVSALPYAGAAQPEFWGAAAKPGAPTRDAGP